MAKFVPGGHGVIRSVNAKDSVRPSVFNDNLSSPREKNGTAASFDQLIESYASMKQ